MRKADLAGKTKRELMDLAKAKKIPGRSAMDKAALIGALSGGSKSSAKATEKLKSESKPKAVGRPRAGSEDQKSDASASSPPRDRAQEKHDGQVDGGRGDRDRGRGDGGQANGASRSDEAARTEEGGRTDRNDRGPRRGRDNRGGRNARDGDRTDRQRPRRNRGPRDDRAPVADTHDDDGDRWNRVDAADPNYGRFLNPTQGNAGRRHSQRGPDRSRGRGADRAGAAKDALRRSGEARRGVGYVPIHNQPDSEETRGGRRRRGRDRQDGRDARQNRGDRNGRPSRQDRQRTSGRGERDRPKDANRKGNERSRPGTWREKEGRRDDRNGADRPSRGSNSSRSRRGGRDARRNEDQVRGHEPAPIQNLGVIGPVDSSELKRELAALRQGQNSGLKPEAKAKNDDRTLSRTHGVDRCRIMARDPYWLHAYWEVTDESLSRGQESLQDSGRYKRILRVHSIPSAIPAADSQPPGFFDIELEEHSSSWYIHVGIPNRDYRVDVGLLAETGLFFPLASSNRVTTPPDQMSSDVDRDWSTEGTDSEKLYELSGGSPVRQIAREQAREAEGVDPGPDPASDSDGAPRPGRTEASLGGVETRTGDTETNGVGLSAEVPPGANFEVLSDHLPPTVFGEAAVGRRVSKAPNRGAVPEKSPGTAPNPSKAASFPSSAEFTTRGLPPAPTSPGAAPTSPAPTSPQTSLWSTSPSRPGTTPKRAEDDFWFVLHTELIVSGATEPNAKVTIQGVPVRLRSDGTFSVRFQLPDGDQTIPVVAVSRDAKFEREITPSVRRETTRDERDTPSARTTAPRRRKKRTR